MSLGRPQHPGYNRKCVHRINRTFCSHLGSAVISALSLQFHVLCKTRTDMSTFQGPFFGLNEIIHVSNSNEFRIITIYEGM